MARLPTSGATVETPFRGKADLQSALAGLCPDGKFSRADAGKIHGRLGKIIGRWYAEEHRLDVEPLIETFTSMGKELTTIANILSAHEPGLQEIHDIAVVSKLATILALGPEVGSRSQADKLITSFQRDASNIAHACLIAGRDLKQSVVGKTGRPKAEWHDDFTALLFEIAKVGGVSPHLNKDRISGAQGGWLFDAAQALETFLDPKMRSPTAVACGKRLERSKTHLRKMNRQNHPSAWGGFVVVTDPKH